jgi:hypothetical protein
MSKSREITPKNTFLFLWDVASVAAMVLFFGFVAVAWGMCLLAMLGIIH